MNRQIRRASKGNGGRGALAPVHTAEDLQTLLDAANAQVEGFTQAVAVRCYHSRGTPGLVMNLETYIAHRKVCQIEAVSTSIAEIAPPEQRIIQVTEHRHFCELCGRRLACEPSECLALPEQKFTCHDFDGSRCQIGQATSTGPLVM